MHSQSTGPAAAVTGRGARQRPTSALIALMLLGALTALALLHLAPPSPRGADAPATEFSATRALAHVEAIAREPHAPGTAAHTAVREYIVAQLKALGLDPQIQEAVVPVEDTATSAAYATVRNIVARMAGSDPGAPARALVLAAHYDSVPTGPGAADDGAGVATLLETVRALQAGPVLQRDVIILMTDGEEMGLLGARAFVAEHPWAAEAGLFLNFEMRGTDGPAIMFEVNGENGALMREFARAVPRPFSTSLATDIYRLMPNDTDVTEFKQVPGAAYLNVAAVGGGIRYHTRLDDVSHLDPQTLQHMGEYGVAVAAHFGDLPLPPERTGDAVWFNAFRWWLVRYPTSWALPLAVLAVLGLFVTLGVGVRRRALRLKECAVGLLALPLALALMAGLVTALVTLAQADWAPGAHAEWLRLASVALGAAPLLGVYGLFRRWVGTAALLGGALLWWAVFAVATAVALPGGSYLFLWPLVGGTIGLGYMLLRGTERATSPAGLGVISICLLPAFLLGIAMTGLFYEALGYLPQAATALVVLVLSLCAAHLEALWRGFRAWLLPVGILAAALGLAALGLFLPYDAEHPGRDALTYGVDANTGRAWWLAPTQDAWTNQFVGGEEWQDEARDFFPLGGYYYRAPAPDPAGLPGQGPQVEVLPGGATDQAERVVTMRVRSARQAGLLAVYVDPDAHLVGDVLVNGRAADRKVNRRGDPAWSLVWIAPPADGFTLQFRLPAGQPLKFRVIDGTLGLPPGTAPRPASLMPGYFGVDWLVPPDSTLVSKNFTL